ncbi:Flp pilus assembly protein TadG [Rhizobium leguminosarum]|uniref:Flp pilus assembly protein TadG n=1 Tax=Rhizobium leguminosarum TaxID=384 RepID=A0AAE2MJ09_RHILE|nr:MULTISPECIES: VWA domain-containing protein [Rhizobium]MBB4290092.1 Flp pilus assembly protein TadG [Rhizobium leguminosarum]MBB4296736.1 Flp pilus assembly protein TadG [Rhizobium leguminosarum]MBB4308004.1 Flp pilus assembly protein TadG [Rhizobium leguminosarum]MBB4415839.1 Flp pilus assembly protein TadG [Rhizobium leguminosarum]MBB4431195.1 Flp pilus assembly protein TadG [Rhizobium esperanzae]
MAILLPGFIADRSGNFGIMTALLMVPLLGTAGMAVDFAHALSLRTQLYAAADAAAVGSIAEKSGAVAAAMTMSGNGTISLGKTDARNIFMSQMSGELADVKVDLGIDVTKAANRLSSQVSFTATVPTTFMRVLGRDSITISGTATAEYQTASFMDFYILLDNTPSMGVGATATDVATMEKNTSDSCAFACHETENKNNYYNLAKKLGVSMRIDVVRQATKELTLTAKSTRVSNNQFRMGVYTFGTKAEDARLTTISDPTDDLDQVRSYTDAVDLMTIPKQGYNNDQQTSFDNALTQMKTIITTPGDGSTSATPQKILFFVSDGVGDSEKPKGCTKKLTGNRCQEPIDTSFCQPLKDKGVRIAVLYTTYLPLPKNSWYNTWISPFQSQIPTKMQECASPGLYFEVTPTQGITDAMKALFLKVIRAPRITS